MAFCIWDGGYLPTESEWNYAATGGEEQRAYPWSVPASSLTIDATYANHTTTPGNCVSPSCRIVDVGATPKGDGRWGQSDLAGNVFEWVLDWYAPYVSPCTDCAYLSVATQRVARGGALISDLKYLRSGVRLPLAPDTRNQLFGFRCARIP